MEQKRVIWIAVATGAFLIIVIVAGFMLYSPAQTTTDVASLQESDTWIVSPDEEKPLSELTLKTETANVFSDAVTTFNINPDGSDIGIDTTNSNPLAPNTATGISTDTTQPSIDQTPTNGNNQLPVESTSSQRITHVQSNSSVVQPSANVEIVQKKANVEIVQPRTQTRASVVVQPAPKRVDPKVETPAPKQKVTVTEYWIQAAAPTERKFAENAREKLATNKINSDIFTTQKDGVTYYRVRVGPYKTKTEAEYWNKLVQEDATFKESYITEVKTKR